MKPSIIQKTFRELFGQPCWGIDHSRWFNLWINFGKPSMRIREPFESKSKSESIRRMAGERRVSLVGQWRLNLFCCYWSLSRSGELLAGFSSSTGRIRKAIHNLEGEKLVSVRINP